jgi:putative hemolysin
MTEVLVTALVLFLLSILLSALSALIERSGPVRLRHWVEEADGNLRMLFDDPERFEAYRFLLALLAKGLPVVLVLALDRLYRGWGLDGPRIVSVLTVVGLVALSEASNRLLVSRVAERFLGFLTPVYRGLLLLLRPLVFVLAPLLPSPQREDGEDGGGEEDEASEEEIEAFIAFGTQEGILEPEEGEWVWGIVDFGETQVKSVMTPRIDVTAAPVDVSPSELVTLFLESGHSRVPLYEDSIDRVVGILHIRDLLRSLETPAQPPVRRLLKPALFVPETRRLDDLLKQMQAQHQQMAVVVDEYGGTSGVVTVEDLLEEIVGEITDEHEVEEQEIELLPGGGLRVDGRVHVERLSEELGVEVEEAPYETVGGMVYAIVGDVPEVGQMVTWNGHQVTVEAVEDRRVRSVLVRRLVGRGLFSMDDELEEEVASLGDDDDD